MAFSVYFLKSVYAQKKKPQSKSNMLFLLQTNTIIQSVFRQWRQLFKHKPLSFSNQCRQLCKCSPLDPSEVSDSSDHTVLLVRLKHQVATSVLTVSPSEHSLSLQKYISPPTPCRRSYLEGCSFAHYGVYSSPWKHIFHLWESNTQLCISLKPTHPQLS